MDGANLDVFQAPSLFPLEEIQRSRANYPNGQFVYQLHLTCDGPRGLSGLCLALDAVGLSIASLKVSRAGSVYCVIEDDGSVDLQRFMESLEKTAVLVRWTTRISFSRVSPSL